MNYHGAVTTEREALIEKLVVSLHLNVPERQLLGSDSISVQEVASVVKRLFQQNGVFPRIARIWKPGEVAFDGCFLVKGSDGKIQLVCQASKPINSTLLSAQKISEYSDLDEAISIFIETEWSRGIDGIPLSRRRT